MPVRQPVFDPPFNVVRASHVELGVRDLERSRAFYVDCLGLLVSDETDDALYLRSVCGGAPSPQPSRRTRGEGGAKPVC
jgi:catechol 2,3-dioxygenase